MIYHDFSVVCNIADVYECFAPEVRSEAQWGRLFWGGKRCRGKAPVMVEIAGGEKFALRAQDAARPSLGDGGVVDDIVRKIVG